MGVPTGKTRGKLQLDLEKILWKNFFLRESVSLRSLGEMKGNEGRF